jgi:NAD(P)H-hydrate epimerase|tara:strand:+ start:194 stop:1048 length:855 start_codon:yes stop_codon:yes gene_type:complete
MDAISEVSEKYVRSVLKPRNPDSRKGENGSVAVIGGGRLYHGAPFLTASSALRCGVDLLYLCVPQTITTAVRALSPNIIVIPRPDVKLTIGAVNKLLRWLPKVDSIVLGPGLGRQRTDGSTKLVRELASDGVKVVLDADALRTDIVNTVKGRNAVITPHLGEFKRLFDIDITTSLDDRVEAVKKMAAKNDITILLKSRIDVISNGTKVILNKTGSPAMTAGGTGDILSGIVAGLLAKGLDAFDAAALGAFFNGLAGEKVAETKGFHLVASDMLDEIPSTMMKFE